MQLPDIALPFRPEFLAPGVFHYQTTGSTNSLLLNDNTLSHGTVVLADYQTAGRGRLQRKWEAPAAQSLLFSILISEKIETFAHVAFSLVPALAVYDTLAEFHPGLNPALKWPNDVLVNNKKICGILAESRSGENGISRVVIGIGLNLNQDAGFFRGELLKTGTSLRVETGETTERIPFFINLLNHLDRHLKEAQGLPDHILVSRWKKHCLLIGKKVIIRSGNSETEGIFHDVADDGSLVLATTDGTRQFYAGDVSLLPWQAVHRDHKHYSIKQT